MACAAVSCKDRPVVLAELVQVQRDGLVERAEGVADWRSAPLGTRFYLGDAARTHDAPAQLRIGEAAHLDMQAHTVLRFGRRGESARAGEQELVVELGAIELVGEGSYQFDIGELEVARSGGVRVSAGGRGSKVELMIGEASLRARGGEATALRAGQVVELPELEPPRDAGPPPAPDAPPPPPPDAAPAPSVSVTLTGKAELRRGANERWARAPRGLASLEPGAQLRLSRGATAAVDNGEIALRVTRGVVAVGDDRGLALLEGSAEARAAPDRGGTVQLPGGGVSLKVRSRGAASELSVSSKESRVRATLGEAVLEGRDERLELRRGESAALSRGGGIRVLVAVPTRADLALEVGDSATIHDVRGATAVEFRFAEACPAGGVVELASSPSFRAPQISGGATSANLLVSGSGKYYRVRCEDRGADGRPVASGRISVIRDSGRRPLPPPPPPFQISVDGRTYRVGYQGAIPAMTVSWRGQEERGFSLHLAQGGKESIFRSDRATYSVPGSKLGEGTYTVWFEKAQTRSKVSTVIIDFDNTAPAVYIDEPDDGGAWGPAGGDLEVRGAVLPGWAATIDGVSLPLDKQRRFRATVPVPPSGTLAIRFSHPQRGVHYYVRRGR
ncbi:MAG: hypothetical protein R3B48_12180 [Kofleriaceae bacterium]